MSALAAGADQMLLSTLASYLTALGVDAQIVVEIGDEILTYDLTTRAKHDDHRPARDHSDAPLRAVRFFWGLLIGATVVSLVATSPTPFCPTYPASSSR